MIDEELRKLRIPLSCPQCEFLMKGKSSSTYLRFGVCMDCFIQFIEGREERWKNGWRPTKEQVERFKDSIR